jgi:hypothetical protein
MSDRDGEITREPWMSRGDFAAREIAASEQYVSSARAAKGFVHESPKASVSVNEYPDDIRAQMAFYDRTEVHRKPGDTSEILGLYVAHPNFAPATLARFAMEGEWNMTAPYEAQLLGELANLGYQELYRIPRNSPAAATEIEVRPGLTSQNGYVALSRVREFIVARQPFNPDLRESVTVMKVFTSALNILELAKADEQAAAEVRLIVASAMCRAIDWSAIIRGLGYDDIEEAILVGELFSDQQHEVLEAVFEKLNQPMRNLTHDQAVIDAIFQANELGQTLRRYNMTMEQVLARLGEERPLELRDSAGIAFVEQNIAQRGDFIIPAVTTYFVR